MKLKEYVLSALTLINKFVSLGKFIIYLTLLIFVIYTKDSIGAYIGNSKIMDLIVIILLFECVSNLLSAILKPSSKNNNN